MSVLLIGATEQKQIKRLIAYATANPVRWETIKDVAIADFTPTLALSDRTQKPGVVRPPSAHVILGNVRVAYSHEEQPAGMFRHISASVRRPGKHPHPMVMAVICEAFGFSKTVCDGLQGNIDAIFATHARVWLEEFDPGHNAVNVIELIDPIGEVAGHG